MLEKYKLNTQQLQNNMMGSVGTGGYLHRDTSNYITHMKVNSGNGKKSRRQTRQADGKSSRRNKKTSNSSSSSSNQQQQPVNHVVPTSNPMVMIRGSLIQNAQQQQMTVDTLSPTTAPSMSSPMTSYNETTHSPPVPYTTAPQFHQQLHISPHSSFLNGQFR